MSVTNNDAVWNVWKKLPLFRITVMHISENQTKFETMFGLPKIDSLASFHDFESFLVQTAGIESPYQFFYKDSESMKPIKSNCEYDEAFKFIKECAEQVEHIEVFVKHWVDKTQSSTNDSTSESAIKDINSTTNSLEEEKDTPSILNISKDEDQVPSWFDSYMKKVKDEIIEEVSKKLTVTIEDIFKTHLEIGQVDSNKNAYAEEKKKLKQRRRKKKKSNGNRESNDATENKTIKKINRILDNKLLQEERIRMFLESRLGRKRPEGPSLKPMGNFLSFEGSDSESSEEKKMDSQSDSNNELDKNLDYESLECPKTEMGKEIDEENLLESDSDNISIISVTSEILDVCEGDFEILPTLSVAEKENQVEKSDSRALESPSFELLSESPSLSIHLEDDHFSLKEIKTDTTSAYVIDINGKVYNQIVREGAMIDLTKCEDDNKNLYSMKLDDNKNADLSYNLKPSGDSQFCDSSELAQSFHSHTTSAPDAFYESKHRFERERDTANANNDNENGNANVNANANADADANANANVNANANANGNGNPRKNKRSLSYEKNQEHEGNEKKFEDFQRNNNYHHRRSSSNEFNGNHAFNRNDQHIILSEVLGIHALHVLTGVEFFFQKFMGTIRNGQRE